MSLTDPTSALQRAATVCTLDCAQELPWDILVRYINFLLYTLAEGLDLGSNLLRSATVVMVIEADPAAVLRGCPIGT